MNENDAVIQKNNDVMGHGKAERSKNEVQMSSSQSYGQSRDERRATTLTLT